ncbi:ADP-ribosylglycohydrolase family protein [bacterium]|nr:ADP-ribosylglycohydrolase family protein [bacterium]
MAELKSHFRGALLGAMAGDVLGFAFEGAPPDESRSVESALLAVDGQYSDDTQMTIALAETLLEEGIDFDQDTLARSFSASFEPWRGYGATASKILLVTRSGMNWEDAVQQYGHMGGSYANGAAMRVSPVALACYKEADRIADTAERQAAVSGHTNPVGVYGAQLQAYMVHYALTAGVNGEVLDIPGFLDQRFHNNEIPNVFYEKMNLLQQMSGSEDAIDVYQIIGAGLMAHEAVCAAGWCVMHGKGDPVQTMNAALRLGGDCDTIGSMAMAITGAYSGESAFPQDLCDKLENEGKGRDYILKLASDLFDKVK